MGLRAHGPSDPLLTTDQQTCRWAVPADRAPRTEESNSLDRGFHRMASRVCSYTQVPKPGAPSGYREGHLGSRVRQKKSDGGTSQAGPSFPHALKGALRSRDEARGGKPPDRREE